MSGAFNGQPIVAGPAAGFFTWLLENMPFSILLVIGLAALFGGTIAGVAGALTGFVLERVMHFVD